ncbi:DUF445 family protein [Stenotrophomonas sp. W1S232]|uniref:DUF445 family protein n=1 Tax=Stenotrophomonas koreensis TaxID=266128 RepID=A0A7W3UYT5_9GAMM|nr:DUF445 family protein [Stenotrophomonas koreensis]MBB1116301.1 DUF445 family protein [Stenotrophomonas koreensis]
MPLTNIPHPVDPRRAQLRRLRLIAVAMLAAMVAGVVTSHLMGGTGAWAWVSAFCEAAAVGALADWFAVVALFRRPLGLPIPHTAILPRNKDRLADSLGVFVRDNFLEPGLIAERLQRLDTARWVGNWLAAPAQRQQLAQLARGWALQLLEVFDEGAVRAAINRFVSEQLLRWDAADTLADVLGLLTADNRHQEVFDAGLQRLGQWLDEPAVHARASELITRYIRKQWPKLASTVDWIKPIEEIGDSLAARIGEALVQELQLVLTDSAHPLRQDYDHWLDGYVQRLRSDPALAARLQDYKAQLAVHPAVTEYVGGLWQRIAAALRSDLAQEDSTVAAHIERALGGLAGALQRDGALRDALNTHIQRAATRIAGRLREVARTHVANTIKSWDDDKLVDQLELSVGRDLQFIRYNGTLVGGLIGLGLHALTQALS